MSFPLPTSHFPLPDFKGRILFDVPMKDYTSFKIGGTADVMVFPVDKIDLLNILKFVSNKDFPVFMLGSGTNLLVRDNGIRGVVINLSGGFKEIKWLASEGSSNGWVRAKVGAGVKIIEIATLCKDKGLSGLEFAIGIPGTAGGAVFMNAGAYGSEMKDVIEAVEVISLNGEEQIFDKNVLKFSYRSSELPINAIITNVQFKFKIDIPENINKKIKEFRDKRKTTQLINWPNAGCIFRNPNESISAGRLIEEANLKGVRVGDAQISEVHGNYIVNLGSASTRDVLSLIAMIRDKIYQTTGILLETEIKVVGED